MSARHRFPFSLSWLLVATLSPVAPAQPVPKPPPVLSEFSSAIEHLASAMSPAVVQIMVRARAMLPDGEGRRAGYFVEQEGTGSGVIVDPSGYIVTNAHVVENASKIDVRVLDRKRPGVPEAHTHLPGKIIGVDKETDLAVVKIEAQGLPTLDFGDSNRVRQGQVVLALGSPLGLQNTLTVGFVSAPRRHLSEESPMAYIQTDAPINPGNSGGPLMDIEGRVIGLNTLIITQSGGSEGIGFAIPSNLVRKVYTTLRKDGRVHRGVIGILPQDITPTLGAALGIDHHPGVILADIAPHGSAEAAGLLPGDIVLSIGTRPITEARQVGNEVFQRDVGDKLTFNVLRGIDHLQIVVAILEKPSSPGDLADLASHDSDLVKELGILALTVDEKVNAILPHLRRLEGVAVAAIPVEFAGLNPGLLTGDVIYEFNGKAVGSVAGLRSALATKKTGDPMALLVERSGQLIYVSFEMQ